MTGSGGIRGRREIEFGPDRVKTRNGTNSDDTCSRSELRIIGCGFWNVNFEEDIV